jgi:hypothetical protein
MGENIIDQTPAKESWSFSRTFPFRAFPRLSPSSPLHNKQWSEEK